MCEFGGAHRAGRSRAPDARGRRVVRGAELDAGQERELPSELVAEERVHPAIRKADVRLPGKGRFPWRKAGPTKSS